MNFKKIALIITQIVLFTVLISPIILTNLITKESGGAVYKHDIWYSLLFFSLSFVYYGYVKYFMGKWYALEYYIIYKDIELMGFIISIQKWRVRILLSSLILLAIYSFL